MSVKIKKAHDSTVAPMAGSATNSATETTSLRLFHLNEGLPSLVEMQAELDEYTSVLMGHEEPPIDQGDMTLLEYANAVYSRAMELTMLLQRAEASGVVVRGSKVYKFRTGELRAFTEMAGRAIDLGSRRVTYAKMEYSMGYG